MLDDIRVLIVEDDEDSREILGMSLATKGAIVQTATSGEDALRHADAFRPNVVLMDLELPGIDGYETFARLRQVPGCNDCVGIALSGHTRNSDRSRSLAVGFAKHLAKPAALADVVRAVALCAPNARLQGSSRQVRSILETLNKGASCQFTSLLRFEGEGKLVSVWTYDRRTPDADPFPVNMAIEASYCVMVRATRSMCVIENARTDEHAADHPEREHVVAYLGVPIFSEQGELFGTLCTYDAEPQCFPASVRSAHESAALALAVILARRGTSDETRARDTAVEARADQLR